MSIKAGPHDISFPWPRRRTYSPEVSADIEAKLAAANAEIATLRAALRETREAASKLRDRAWALGKKFDREIVSELGGENCHALWYRCEQVDAVLAKHEEADRG